MRLDPIVDRLLRCMNEANYSKRVASLCVDMVIDAPFVTDTALCEDAEGPVRRFFARIVSVSAIKKAYLLIDLAARFVAVWRLVERPTAGAAPSATSPLPSALSFVGELVQLLTMREYDSSLHHRADDEAHGAQSLFADGQEQGQKGPEVGPPIVRCVRQALATWEWDWDGCTRCHAEFKSPLSIRAHTHTA